MGIMDMFNGLMKPAAPAAPAPGQPTPPGNIPANAAATGEASTGAAANGVLPDGSTKPAEPAPFEEFKTLWDTAPVDPNKPASDGTVFGAVDPKKFTEAAGKIDFSKVVTPEQLQAIAAGGEGAMKSFAEAMNKVAQGVYAQSAFASTKIVESALAKANERFMAELPQHIKRQTVTDSLRGENPIFSNPAVAPIISALEKQMTVKYPNATAPEITAMAKQYVEKLGESFTPPKPEPAAAKGGRKTEDWSKFLE